MSTLKTSNGVVETYGRGSYLQTYKNNKFYPLDPRVEEVDIEDIAHSLSLMCRWAGHVRDFYSVAQHAVLGSYQVPPEYAFEFLNHDDSEAYCVDIPRPLKYAKGMEGYLIIEESVDATIRLALGLPIEMAPAVKEADNRMLLTEQRDLRNDPKLLKEMSDRLGLQPYDFRISPWPPVMAEQNFLMRFRQLNGQRA
jgi:hypothetical protein